MNWTSRIFFLSLALFFSTPFLAIGGLADPYETTRILTFSLAVIGIISTTLWRVYSDSDFKQKVGGIVRHPIVLIYGILIGWLFVRSIPVFSSEVWWGTWQRFDGLFFEFSWLLVIVCIAAWIQESHFSKLEGYLLWVLGCVFLISTVVFPALSLDRFIAELPGGRFSASVGNPLYFAGLLLFVPWFALRIKNRWVSIVAMLASVGFLFLSDTRGAFAAALAGVVIYIWENKKIVRGVRLAVAVLTVAGVIIGVGLFVTGKINSTRMATISTRVALWKSGIHSLRAQPLIGFGIGAHRDIIDRAAVALSEASYGEISDSSHSAYLDLALKGGLVALLVFIVWIAIVYRSLPDPLSRATFVAYLILIAAAPFMPWTAIPLVLIIARSIHTKRHYSSVYTGLLYGAGTIVGISAAAVIAVTTYNAVYLDNVSRLLLNRTYIDLPARSLITARVLPFTSDEMIQLLRMTSPTTNQAVSPGYSSFIESFVKPVFSIVESRALHPDAYNVAAVWANMYATSGLTADNIGWLNRSLALQERALAINPDRPAAVFQIADTLREVGRIQDAIAELKAFAERNPRLPEAQVYYAIMVDISGDTATAFNIEQSAKQNFPDYSWKKDFLDWFADIEKRSAKKSK